MNTSKRNNIISTIAALILFVSFVKGQNDNDETSIKVNTYLVNIPVVVSDKKGQYVAGLEKENFSIIQDGVKQNIEFFAGVESPMTVAILIDTSSSTENFLSEITGAAHKFIKVFRPEDKGMIVTFDYEIKTICPLTSDTKKLSNAIYKVRKGSSAGSNMQDAMFHLLTTDFVKVKGRKAIVVLTDGQVAGSTSNDKLLNAITKTDIVVYQILYNVEDLLSHKVSIPKSLKTRDGRVITSREEIKKIFDEEFDNQIRFINSLAESTGGEIYLNKAKDFQKSFQEIADDLKKQYLLGFYPENADDGKSHQITVEVNPKDFMIRTKSRIRLKISN